MSREMIIASSRHETKIALTEEGQVVEVYIEREKEVGLAGSIYKGRVTRVLPGMQSAFVDIGLDRDAFLYVSDFSENLEGLDLAESAEESTEESGEAAESDTPGDETEAKDRSASRPRGRTSSRRPRRSSSTRRGRPSKTAAEASGPTDGAAAAAPDASPDATPTLADGQTAYLDSTAERTEEPAGAPPREQSSEVVTADVPDLKLPERKTPGRGRSPRSGTRRPRGSRGGGRGRTRTAPSSTAPPIETSEPDKPIDGAAPGTPSTTAPTTAPRAKSSGPALLPGESIKALRNSDGAELAEAAPVAAPAPAPAPAPDQEATEPAPENTGNSTTDAVETRLSDEIPAKTPESDAEAETPARSAKAKHIAPKEKKSGVPEQDSEDSEGDSVSDGFSAFPTEAFSSDTREELEETLADLGRVRHYEGQAGLPPSLEERTGGGVEWQEDSEEETITEVEIDLEEDSEDAEIPDSDEEMLELEPAASEGLAEDDADDGEPAQEDVKKPGRPSRSRSRRSPAKRSTQARTSRSSTRSTKTSTRAPRAKRTTRSSARSTSRSKSTTRRRTSARPSLGQPAIADLLKAGQEIIVQIAKEQIGQKGARITSHVTLPGRYLVYMPTIDHIGVSRKIGTAEERARLRRVLTEMKGSAGGGFVVRTAASGASDDELKADVDYLVNLWRDMVKSADEQRSPALLHRDLDLTHRLLRDHLSSDFDAVWVNSEEEYADIVEFASKFLSNLESKIKLYTKDEPIFDNMGIQQEIDRALRPKVWLKSGGYIVINQTEALVAIDINTGKFVGKGSTRLEDTIVKTNVEAIKEIIRQIRLRDLGGIIVVDFIDMEDRRNQNKVMRALEQALYADRQPSKILPFNEFGLVAITRKRSRQSLERVLCQSCPYCTGTGTLKSIQTICIEIQEEASRMAGEMDAPELTIRANPDIIAALKGDASLLMKELEDDAGKAIILEADQSLHFEHYNIF